LIPNAIFFAALDIEKMVDQLFSIIDDKRLNSVETRTNFKELVHQFDEILGNSASYNGAEKINSLDDKFVWETWNSIIQGVDKIIDAEGEVRPQVKRVLSSTDASFFPAVDDSENNPRQSTNPRATRR